MKLLVLAAMLAPASAPAAAPPPPAPARAEAPAPAIVVRGERMEETGAALRACIARRCPTDEDVDASLAYAESQLEGGLYHEARTTLLRSLDRNKKQAKRYPVPVSDLYRANGKVAAHLGLDRDYFTSTLSMLRALKAGLPPDDYRLFGARMEVAAAMGRLRGHEAARNAYAELAKDARQQGRPDIAAMAELRSILNHYPPYARAPLIREIARSQDPAMRAAVLEARLALINVARASGDKEQAALLMRELSGLKINRPVLIYAPPFEMTVRELDPETNVTNAGYTMEIGSHVTRLATSGSFSETRRVAGNFDDKWIDVGFWVTREGKVGELKVLRHDGDTSWAGPLLQSIQGRLYTPGNGNALDSYRVERYTYTAGYGPETGSHMQQRTPKARVEYLDLAGDGLAAPE
ncbi:MAG: hypothetical protein JOZ90_00540 [Alphaproteobacteria bacterium]|nr:hypothetical protein [Alphaproteobacteria bacterium]MBV9372273.1 hypothetical protein [Alphaproteobacteria bacterium]MBV9899565.1 hypothetical protein [Alphaproteobacteria bacterium]